MIEEAKVNALIRDEKSPEVKARLVGCRAPSAGAWLTTPLTDPLLRFNSVHFSLAVRFRLGLPPQEDLRTECACGNVITSDHFLVCNRLKRTSMTTRHDRVLYLLARLARTVNIATRVEVPLENQKRPDANFFLHNRSIATDVSIIHPASKTYAKKAAKALGAAARREGEKKREYSEQARSENLDFIPFVLETFGGFGKEAVTLQEILTDEGSLNGMGNLGGMKARTFFTRALSVCLQSGNALVMQEGCAMTRQAANRASRDL